MKQPTDSGERDTMGTGAVREPDTKKPRPDLISPFFTLRLGKWLSLGAAKYDSRNWEKGINNTRHLASAERHLAQYKAGNTDEDHLIAAACNLMFLVHNEAMIELGLLPNELDDLPLYMKKEVATLPEYEPEEK